MDRSTKEATVGMLHEKMSKAVFVAALEFGKVDSNTTIELRKAMRAGKVEYRVVKNTLALRAAKGTGVEQMSAYFAGPVAVAIGFGDVVAPAKVLMAFVKKAPQALKVKAAVAEGRLLDAAGVEALSRMPGLPETRAQILAMIKTPAATLVRMIAAPGSSLARVVKAHADKAGEGQKAA